MAVGFGHVLDLCALHPQQVDVNPDEGLIHDMQACARQKRMHIGDTAMSRILDRKHPQIDLALRDLVDNLLESGAGDRFENSGATVGRPDANRRQVHPEMQCDRSSGGFLVENWPHGAFRRASTP